MEVPLDEKALGKAWPGKRLLPSSISVNWPSELRSEFRSEFKSSSEERRYLEEGSGPDKGERSEDVGGDEGFRGVRSVGATGWLLDECEYFPAC